MCSLCDSSCSQAAALAEAAGTEVSMPDQTRRTAAKWWGATRNIVPSLTHSSVSQHLRQHGVPHTMLVPLGDGLPTADIAIQPITGSRSVAVQVRTLAVQGFVRIMLPLGSPSFLKWADRAPVLQRPPHLSRAGCAKT